MYKLNKNQHSVNIDETTVYKTTPLYTRHHINKIKGTLKWIGEKSVIQEVRSADIYMHDLPPWDQDIHPVLQVVHRQASTYQYPKLK